MTTYILPDAVSRSGAVAPRLGPELQARIGHQLRAVYDEIAEQPVPERFVKLLEELELKQATKP